MAKVNFQVKGIDIVTRNFEEMARTSEPSVDGFLNVLGRTTVDLLRANTPVDTGKLRDSWRYRITKAGGEGKVRCVVAEDQEFKLRLVTFGTRFIQPDPFVDRVEVVMQSFVANLLGQAFDERGHKWYRESGFTSDIKRANIGKIPGAGTGTNYNKRRSTGSFGLKRPSKGFKTLSRRVGRKSRRVSGL